MDREKSCSAEYFLILSLADCICLHSLFETNKQRQQNKQTKATKPPTHKIKLLVLSEYLEELLSPAAEAVVSSVCY